jgi:hypothetical protein
MEKKKQGDHRQRGDLISLLTKNWNTHTHTELYPRRQNSTVSVYITSLMGLETQWKWKKMEKTISPMNFRRVYVKTKLIIVYMEK